MDSVLHIEPITRSTPAPFSIGHTEYLFYGEKLTDDDESVGTPTSKLKLGAPFKSADIKLGSPLETHDYGSTLTEIPMVKTIERAPDPTRNDGYVYSETLHYFKDQKTLIPFRTKVRSCFGQSTRLTHLPSLNHIRESLTGSPYKVCDPRSEIISDIALKDQLFHRNPHHPLRDWLTYELAPTLAKRNTNNTSFDTVDTNQMIHRYIQQVHNTPSELSAVNLREIASVIAVNSPLTPLPYFSDESIVRPLLDFRHRIVPHTVDLGSYGRLNLQNLENIQYNPSAFKSVCELLDYISLTDFNVDIVINTDNDLTFYHEHVAIDRFGLFADNHAGVYRAETILKDCIDGYTLSDILKLFLDYHTDMTSEIEDLIYNNSIKIKLMKTITDEAAVLLYHVDSSHDDRPLIGVYFDIALLSLAPMSIMPEPIAN